MASPVQAAAFVAISAAANRLEAPLQFATVAALRAQGLALIAAAPGAELTLDLSAVVYQIVLKHS